MAAALTAGGRSGPGALAAVLAYRILNFWLVILAGWAVMLRLGDRPGAAGTGLGRPGRAGPPRHRGRPGTLHRPDERWWTRHGRGVPDARRAGT